MRVRTTSLSNTIPNRILLITPDLVRLVLFFCSLIVAAYTDLRFRTIPNWLTILATLAGILMSCLSHGVGGALLSLLGWFLGFSPFYILYRKGGLGAGDVKLMGMVGALGGPRLVIVSFWYTSLIGFVMASLKLWQEGQMKSGFGRSLELIVRVFGIRTKAGSDAKEKALTIPYGLAIVFGSYAAYFAMNF